MEYTVVFTISENFLNYFNNYIIITILGSKLLYLQKHYNIPSSSIASISSSGTSESKLSSVSESSSEPSFCSG